MKNFLAPVIVGCCCLGSVSSATSEVVIAGGSLDGRLLINELNCSSCHAAESRWEHLPPKQAPRLGDLGARVAPQYLRDFLADPQAVKPGTAMPGLLHRLPTEKRAETIEDLVHFLVSLGGPMQGESPTEYFDNEKHARQMSDRGRELYHEVGCVACHKTHEPPPKHKIDSDAAGEDERPADDAGDRVVVPLPDLAKKTTTVHLADFLRHPLHLRPSGRMPSLKLSPEEAQAIAAYLLRDQLPTKEKQDKPETDSPAASPPFKLDKSRAARGRKAFASLGCANCHETGWEAKSREIDLRLWLDAAEAFNSSGKRPPNPKNAFDGDPDSTVHQDGKRDSGVVMQLKGRPPVVTAVTLVGSDRARERNPGKFTLEGSTDGKSFQKIATKSVPPFVTKNRTHTLAFDNDKAYSSYRLTFNEAQNPKKAKGIHVAEIRLHEALDSSQHVKPEKQAKPLAQLQAAADGGCLSAIVDAGRPQFAISAAQRKALQAAVNASNKPHAELTAEQRVDHVMTGLNCYACHERGDQGGPHPKIADYFTYETVVDLGDEGRLPPPLHRVGAKLTKAGFDDMLHAGKKYRTYMATRMPLFGEKNVGQLPGLLEQADEGKIPAYEPDTSPTIRGDGWRLIGAQTLACINCHAWNDLRLPGAEGMDLAESPRRLKPAWFHAWLKKPNALKPGTRMPTAWPGGKSFFPKILDGDSDRQIDAIWAYLKAGPGAGAPQGLTEQGEQLIKPEDHPLVFRTFLSGVSAHAILVGFPGAPHFAFDANRVRMVLAWNGDFVTTRHAWSGRAGRYATIHKKDAVILPEGPTFARLQSLEDAWPKDVPKNRKIGSDRTPEGWRFVGYRFDKQRMPTLRYRFGEIEIEESPSSRFTGGAATAVRTLRLTAPSEVKDVYMIVARNTEIEAGPEGGRFVVGPREQVRIHGDGKPILRKQDKQTELIVPVKFRPGGSKYEAEITVEVTW